MSNSPDTVGAILARTRNILANHRISAESTNLAQLSLSAKRLAQQNEVSQDEEHVAQIFFAQRGWDLSKHIQNVLTSQQIFTPQHANPILDFDIDQYIENQQDFVVSNLFQHTLDYHSIQSTDVFSQMITDDWNTNKLNIIQQLNYSIPVPSSTDPLGASSAQQRIPLHISQPFASLSSTQDMYASSLLNFVRAAQKSHEAKDLASLRDAILAIPANFADISRLLVQQELTAPLSTTNVSNQYDPNSFNQNTTFSLKQHEQMTEFWLWFESLSSVMRLVHDQSNADLMARANAADLNKSIDMDSTYGGISVDAQQPSAVQRYRYKNWFLQTKTEHSIIATIDYLQQSFIEHMTSQISQDADLSNEYNNHIQNVEDDDQLMIELVSIYCRSRDFKTRFITQSYNTQQNSTMNTTMNTTALLSAQAKNFQHNPNIDISRENIWCSVYCCIRSGYYQSAIKILQDTLTNTSHRVFYTDLNCSALIQVLQLYLQNQQNPVVECALPPALWTQLYNEMNCPVGPTQANTNIDFNASGNPFRKAIYSILGHFPITPTEMKQTVTPFVFITIEDFIWYRLRLITQQTLPTTVASGYRLLSASQANANVINGVAQTTNLTEQLALSNLQGSILSRGKSYFAQQSGTGVNASVTNPMLYVHILFLTQQYERAIVELYTVNPTLGFHLAIVCLVFGLIRSTDYSSDILIPINISLKTIQQLQQSAQQTKHISNSHFGMSLLYQSHHTRYAINMYKLIIDYIQAIQAASPSYSLYYAYCTRFIPLFGNIHLYQSYIHDATSDPASPQRLRSIEHNAAMVFNPQIPKSILNYYNSTIMNLNSPISHLVLTYEQSSQLHQNLQRFTQNHPNAYVDENSDPNSVADIHDISLLLNSTALNYTTMNNVAAGNDINTSVLFNTTTNANNNPANSHEIKLVSYCGVELPIVLDLLLVNKADGSLFLGPNQHIYNFKYIPTLQNHAASSGLLHEFYPNNIIAVIVKMVVERDSHE